jgi:membrane protease YdiL (CAAX protease family)
MSALVRIGRTFPLLSFVFLACLFGWSLYIGAFLRGGSGATNLPLGPFLAALVVLPCQGRAELRAWLRRLRDWRGSLRWYLLAVLAPLTLHVLIVVANHWLGAPLPTSGQLASWPQVPVTFLVMLVIVGIGEEAGWTAYAAPILLRRHRLLVAWVLASAMRILWHLPLMISGDLPWTVGTVGNAAFTMVTLQVLIASGGRWSLVAVWHAMLNAAGGAFFFTMVSGDDETRLGLLLAGVYSVVATLAYVAGGRRSRSRDEVPAGDGTDGHSGPAGAVTAEPAPSGIAG